MTDNRTTELLPCPFCGGKAWIVHFTQEACYVLCENIDCMAKQKVYGTKDEAIAAWNSRAERTCRIVESEPDDEAWVYRHEFSCECGQRNLFTTDRMPPNYCPNCGAKVVDA